MKKDRAMWIIILLCLITLGLLMLPKNVGASDGYPKGVEVFEVGDHTCVLYSVNGGDKAVMECFCPCLSNCEKSESQPTLSPTDKPKEPTVVPTVEPTPVPTVEPTEKPKCNSGRGNGSEGSPDCDPGKSYKNQGGD